MCFSVASFGSVGPRSISHRQQILSAMALSARRAWLLLLGLAWLHFKSLALVAGALGDLKEDFLKISKDTKPGKLAGKLRLLYLDQEFPAAIHVAWFRSAFLAARRWGSSRSRAACSQS